MNVFWPALALVAAVVSFAILAALHFLEPAMSPVERTLSEYVLTGKGRMGFPLAAASLGLSAFCLAAELAYWPLALFGAAMAAAAVFPADSMDPRDGDFILTRSGTIHALAGLVAIVALSAAAWRLGPTLTKLAPGWDRWTAAASWLPLSGAAIFLASVVARGPLERLTGRVSLHGIGERAGFLSFVLWLAFTSMVLLGK